MANADKRVRFATDWAQACAAQDEILFSPIMDGLPPGAASVLSILPIHDVNGRMLDAILSGPRAGPRVALGVLAVDPLRKWSRLFTQFRECGVARIFTWPSVGLFPPNMQRDLEPQSFSFDREVDFVRAAAGEGFHVTATVFEASQAARVVAAGAHRILLHPPLPKPDENWGGAAMLGWLDREIATIERLNCEILIYSEATGPEERFDFRHEVLFYGA